MGWQPVKLRAIHSRTITVPKTIMRYIPLSRRLKQSARVGRPLLGLFGLSRLFG